MVILQPTCTNLEPGNKKTIEKNAAVNFIKTLEIFPERLIPSLVRLRRGGTRGRIKDFVSIAGRARRTIQEHVGANRVEMHCTFVSNFNVCTLRNRDQPVNAWAGVPTWMSPVIT